METAAEENAVNPARVRRDALHALTDLPNVGPSIAGDLRLIGIERPQQLLAADALSMYEALCRKTGVRHDPCVIDVFLSITAFMRGEDARPWWDFTAQRKTLCATPAAPSTRTGPRRRG